VSLLISQQSKISCESLEPQLTAALKAITHRASKAVILSARKIIDTWLRVSANSECDLVKMFAEIRLG